MASHHDGCGSSSTAATSTAAEPFANMQLLFVINTAFHGSGKIVYSWSPLSLCVATTGTTRVVHIFDSRGQLLEQIVPPSPSVCTALEWNCTGEVLAITQASSAVLVLWYMGTGEKREVDVGYRDITFLKWAPSGGLLALGTSKGAVIIYNSRTHARREAEGRHKRRIVCGDWNGNECLAYASEDRQITVASPEGRTIVNFKCKCKAHGVSFGGAREVNGSIVSVNMEGRTILLYNLLEKDNALELAFQQKYGRIVAYKWFGDGLIMAGFASGYVVVSSVNQSLSPDDRAHSCALCALVDLLDALSFFCIARDRLLLIMHTRCFADDYNSATLLFQ
jgi:WD repeat-containing protein 19